MLRSAQRSMIQVLDHYILDFIINQKTRLLFK